jgi:hypothetical protein
MVEIRKALKQLPKPAWKKIVFAYIDELYKEWVTPENPFTPTVSIDYPKLLEEIDIFISMPKLKVNIFADITLSVKNGMGLVKSSTRLKYHGEMLHEFIADIYQIRPPDFVITDAIIAGEGQGPMEVTPYPLNLIICGNNGLAVDSVCCHLMDINPYTIRHLQLLHESGYGPLDLEEMRVETLETLDSHVHQFMRPDRNLSDLAPNVHIYAGEACAHGCPAFIRGGLDAYGFNKGWENLGEIHILVGKNIRLTPEQLKQLPHNATVVYGDCAKDYKKYGRFLPGCAPDYLKAYLLYMFTPLGKSPTSSHMEYRTLLSSYLKHYFAALSGKKFKKMK